MNISAHFDHQSKKDDKEHFMHLIQVAMADGTIDQKELRMLHRFGIKMGFTEPEIDNLIVSTNESAYNPPYELSKRFEQIYDIVKMVLADGKIEKNEIHLTNRFATKSGFKESEIPNLIVLLINGINEGKDEDDLFAVYKNELRS
jgi:uncharacterized tellurite resistance protein B-like protein